MVQRRTEFWTYERGHGRLRSKSGMLLGLASDAENVTFLGASRRRTASRIRYYVCAALAGPLALLLFGVIMNGPASIAILLTVAVVALGAFYIGRASTIRVDEAYPMGSFAAIAVAAALMVSAVSLYVLAIAVLTQHL